MRVQNNNKNATRAHPKKNQVAQKNGGNHRPVELRAPQIASTKATPQQKRRRVLRLSAFFTIVLPTLLAGIYFGLIASDQYAVEVRFAVRGVESRAATDILSMVTGVSSGGSTTTDSYILMDFIHSRALLDQLAKKIDLKKTYSRTEIDYLARFDPDDPIEDFVTYWESMAAIDFDTSSNIVVVETRAFTPEDAKKVSQVVIDLSEKLINDLSAKARNDAVGFAQKEVTRMEKRLKEKLKAVRFFREKERIIDPSKTAESRLALLATLEGNLGIERAKLSSLRQFMDKNSPSVKILTSKISALESQVQKERTKLGQNETGKTIVSSRLTKLLEDYQGLLTEQGFSEKALISALAALETTKIEASRQQRYLAIFVKPTLPEDSIYPERTFNTLIIFIFSSMLWAIGVLLVYAIRDHT